MFEEFPDYVVHREGKIYSKFSDKFLKAQRMGNRNYVCMSQIAQEKRQAKTFRIDYLVATVYVTNPNKFSLIHHMDYNTLNDNSNNLEWVDAIPKKQPLREKGVILPMFPDYIIYKDGTIYSQLSNKFLKFQ